MRLSSLLFSSLLVSGAVAQVAIPPHTAVYNGFTRGYNFVSSIPFNIIALELPTNAQQAGDTASFMVRVNGTEVLRNVGGSSALIATALTILPGDVVDILGNWSPAVTGNFTAHNSYSASFALPGFATTIEGVAHNLVRTGWQWDIGDASYLSGAYLAPTGGQLGRVLMYTSSAGGTVATNTTLGTGCGPTVAGGSFYENFATAAAFDLASNAITATVAGGNRVVTLGGTYNAVGSLGTPTALALTDDSSVAAGTLGLTVGSNGWVAFGSGNSNAFTPSTVTMLANPAAAYYSWHDLNPAAVGSGQVQYEEAGTLAQVTFDGVYDFGGTTAANANFIQFQIDTATGSCVIAWGAMSTLGGTGWLVGYSPAGASADPGNTDLSVALPMSPLVLPVGSAPLVLSALTRPVLGTSWNQRVSSIPSGTVFGVNIFGVGDPGILDLSFLGMPMCQLRASLDVIQGPWFPGGSTYDYSFAVPATPASLVGFQLFTQAATFGLPPVNAFGAITSNGIKGTLGDL
ncbi:MAG TPA: hypothetical protein VFZ65_10455 [Planctomycetota bacterium]|nr:hypothetical protein [Planctomycetota bacterium]